MFLKTREELVEKVIDEVKKIHSYEVPCVISLGIEKGNLAFLEWIREETKA
jgi:periplasmic divalent cation tolerance protein